MFPDIFPALRTYLLPLVGGVPIVTVRPDPLPDTFVQFRRSGGTVQLPVRDRPRYDAYAWAPTAEECMTLALTVRTAVWALAGTNTLGVMVYRVEELLGPRDFDDPNTSRPRVWATYSLDVRADDAVHISPSVG